MKFIIPILIIFTLSNFADTLNIELQIRPRSEFRNGFKTPILESQDPAFFTEQRSRLNLDFRKDKYEVYLSLQDIRVWGGTNQIYKSDRALTNIFQAYGKYNFTDEFSFKIGRQEWNYNNERFLGGLDWAQQGRSHDGLLLRYKKNGFFIDAVFAYNQNVVFEASRFTGRFYDSLGNYKSNAFLLAHKEFENFKIEGIFHNDGRQVRSDSSIAHRQTIGTIFDGSASNFIYGGEAYYQMGQNDKSVDINAFMFNGFIGYKTKLTPIILAVDYLSGTSLADSLDGPSDNSFIPLYGTNHKFYGFMDYFYVGSNHGQGGRTAGLIDIHLDTKWKLGEKNALVANLHYFASEADLFEDVNNFSEKADPYLGMELDLVYVLNLTSDIVMNLGYSHMFVGESMKLVKDGGNFSENQSWAWLMFSFKPTILSL